MNKEDIIRMAQEAGILETLSGKEAWRGFAERFAALVVAAERERIKQANMPEIEKINAHIKTLEDAVAAEREACASICLQEAPSIDGELIAEAIRARGQK